MPGIEPTIQAQRTFLPGLASFKNATRLAWNTTLDLVFPPHCASCGKVDTSWCPQCQRKLKEFPIERMQRQLNRDLVVVATGVHSDILRTAIHAFKYQGVVELAIPLAERMIQVLDTLGYQADGLMPVPIHAERRRQRGYNQAELLAEAITYQCGIPVLPDSLVRHKETMSQVNLTMREREQNVRDAFTATHKLPDARVFLIDDVVTTGATLNACAQAIAAAGASQVIGLTIATATDLATR